MNVKEVLVRCPECCYEMGLDVGVIADPQNLYDEQKADIASLLYTELTLEQLEEIKTKYLKS